MNFFSSKFYCLLSIIVCLLSAPALVSAAPQQKIPAASQSALAKFESQFNSKLGVYAIDAATGKSIAYRANERFPMQSTFKLIAVAAVLKQSERERGLLQKKINYTQQDLVAWSPITKKHISSGMTIAQLSAAAISYSDNTAANLLMKQLGGPSAVTAFARSIGDNTFHLNNWEPNLNSNPHSKQDSSTPVAMTQATQKIVLGEALSPTLRKQLTAWMSDAATGGKRIRAGVPERWRVADKTGSGEYYGIANDIGVIWPPGCAPIVVAIYTLQNQKNATVRENMVAFATHLILSEFSKTDRCLNKIIT